MSQILNESDVLEYIAEQDAAGLNRIAEMIQIRRRHIAEKQKVNFRVGDSVSFVGRKTGLWKGTQRGIISKKNRKNAKVQVPHPTYGYDVTWNVPYTQLQKSD